MPRLHAIYQRIRGVNDPTVDQALAAALPSADPVAVKLITLLTLERNHPEGTAGLVACFDELPSDMQTVVLRHSRNLYRPLRHVASDMDHPQAQVNALEIIAAGHNAPMAYVLVDQLREGSPELKEKAGKSLLALARWVQPQTPPARSVPKPAIASTPDMTAATPFPSDTQVAHGSDGARPDDAAADHCTPDAAVFIQDAVEQAVALYQIHQQTTVVEAFLQLLPRPMTRVFRELEDYQHAAATPLRAMLIGASTTTIRRALLPMLAHAPLRRDALAGLLHCARHDLLSDVLQNCHLLLDRKVAAALHTVPVNVRLFPALNRLAAVPYSAARGLPLWLKHIPLTPTDRAEALTALQGHDDVLVRAAALRDLIAIALRGEVMPAQIDEWVSRFCHDGEVVLARMALRHLLRRPWTGLPRLMLQLVNSPHADVRDLSCKHLAPVGFEKFWSAWPKLDFKHKLAAGSALLKIDPNFDRQLAARLVSADRGDRVRSLSMVHALHQGVRFEKPLIALAADTDAFVAASAVRALGTVQSQGAIEALGHALSHADSRVRANAAEALHQLQSTQHMQKLMQMAQADDPRPRANAIGTLMQLRAADALSALTGMLHDHRPAQRISALWLVDHMGLLEVARHVAALSQGDPDTQVRQRAGRVIQQLAQTLGVHISDTGLPNPGDNATDDDAAYDHLFHTISSEPAPDLKCQGDTCDNPVSAQIPANMSEFARPDSPANSPCPAPLVVTPSGQGAVGGGSGDGPR